MNAEALPTGMTDAEALAFDRAAISLTRQLLPLLNGHTASVVTSVLVGIVATVASMSADPDGFCLMVAHEAIAIGHDAWDPVGKPH